MFRLSLLLHKSRSIPMQRFFCQTNGKCYIIKTKDGGKKIVYESEIMQKFRERERTEPQKQLTLRPEIWNWERVMRSARQLVSRSYQHSVVLIERYKVQEKFEELKRKQVVKFKAIIAKAPEVYEEQMEVIRASEGYKKTKELPHQIVPFAKTSIVKVRQYYGIFAESQIKAYLDKIIIWLWINGKFYSIKIFNFIREAYFDKPSIEIKKKKLD